MAEELGDSIRKMLNDNLKTSQAEALGELSEGWAEEYDAGYLRPKSDRGNFWDREEADEFKGNLQLLQKAAGTAENTRTRERRELLRRNALINPNIITAYSGSNAGPFRPRVSHVSYRTLRMMSLRDPVVAALMQTRINQMVAFSKPQASRFDLGYKIVPRDPNMQIMPDSQEEREVKMLTEFIKNTGFTNYRHPDDIIDFGTFLRLATRDRLTYGAVAIETIRDRSGRIHSFYMAPTDTIFYANEGVSDNFLTGIKNANFTAYASQGFSNQKEFVQNQAERIKWGPYRYVQAIEGKVVQAFSRSDMIYKLGNPQTFIENNGYCVSELEMAIGVVTAHMQAENYNKLFFTHGFAARGLLHIKGDITRQQLDTFRAHWYAQVAGNSNSWRTPIVGGVDDVKWVPFSASNREMEYSVYIDHLIRTLSAIFQISPLEFGFDHLLKGSNSRTMSESSNEWKIQESKERGLRPIINFFEDIINHDILPHVDPDLASKYVFAFVGLDAEDKAEELERHQVQLQVHSSMNEIRKEIEKEPVLGGEIVLNPAYVEALKQYLTVGEVREYIFKIAGSAKDPRFDYIPDGQYLSNMQLAQQQQMAAAGMMPPGGEGGPEGAPPGGAPMPPPEMTPDQGGVPTIGALPADQAMNIRSKVESYMIRNKVDSHLLRQKVEDFLAQNPDVASGNGGGDGTIKDKVERYLIEEKVNQFIEANPDAVEELLEDEEEEETPVTPEEEVVEDEEEVPPPEEESEEEEIPEESEDEEEEEEKDDE